MNEASTKLVVSIPKQQAQLFIKGRLSKTYIVSTSANGAGCENGSNKTPYGLFAVSEKFGAGALLGTVFKSREPTGGIWSNDKENPLSQSEEDLILTRILWLEGREAHNRNTKDRYVYIHGTNREDLLGISASHGCIRMSNKDVVELFELMPVGTLVEILPSSA